MIRSLSWAGSLFALVLFAGCGNPTPPNPASTPVAQNDGEHEHAKGAHGGQIVPIGADNYHAEPVLTSGGAVRLHMLQQDESKVLSVAAQELNAFVRPHEGGEAIEVVFKPTPQAGDPSGETSVFTATLPAALRGQSLQVTIPSITIRGERFRIAFPLEAATNHAAMPQKVTSEEEQKLYLTAGGLYTEADIAANGRTTPSAKFGGIMSAHDMKPKAGDQICPITETKANQKFTWIVAGKPYTFCCPPCIDEFVRLAKEDPSSIKDPSAYVKR